MVSVGKHSLSSKIIDLLELRQFLQFYTVIICVGSICVLDSMSGQVEDANKSILVVEIFCS